MLMLAIAPLVLTLRMQRNSILKRNSAGNHNINLPYRPGAHGDETDPY